MTRVYQPKFLNDGVTPNPKFKPHKRSGKKPPRSSLSPEQLEAVRAKQRVVNSKRSPEARHNRTDRPLICRRPLFGWDGEGANFESGEPHRYIFLAVEEERGSQGATFADGIPEVRPWLDASLTDAKGIDSHRALEFLALELERRSHGINVGFFFSYDVNMILRDLPVSNLRELHRTGETQWRKFKIEYRPRKSFAVSMRTAIVDGDAVEWVYQGGRIWDVFGFFQSSFIEALLKYKILPPDELKLMHSMKMSRSTFRPEELENISRYCRDECRALTALMRQVLESHEGADLELKRFDGAGASAAALLRREKVKQHMGPPIGTWPEAVRDAAQYAYGGGRIELFQFGHHGPQVFRYDLRSAYPAAMVDLPCLKCGGWSNTPELGAFPFQLVRVEWDLAMARPDAQEMYPFFWRLNDGRIYYPSQGAGWYWRPEVEAASTLLSRCVWIGAIRVREVWSYLPLCQHRPFAFVPSVFAERARLKSVGHGAEKALKLAINAMYGRCAMRVGSRNGKPPGSHQLEWAGFTTSQTRAWLLTEAIEAALSGDLVMLATDGIFTTRALGLDTPGLGGWEESSFESGTFVQSGVYWLGKGENESVYYRGFDRGALTRPAILDAWKKHQATLQCPLTRFVTLGRALAAKDPREKWRTWAKEDRELELIPGAGMKRMSESWGKLSPHRRLYRTKPVQPFVGLSFSSASQLPWRDLKGARRDDWDDTDDNHAGEE
jgi:hypothetical protein